MDKHWTLKSDWIETSGDRDLSPGAMFSYSKEGGYNIWDHMFIMQRIIEYQGEKVYLCFSGGESASYMVVSI